MLIDVMIWEFSILSFIEFRLSTYISRPGTSREAATILVHDLLS